MIPYRINLNDLSAGDVIDNYSSFIWTERYIESGDFVLTTGDIDKTLKNLPIGSMLGEVGSDEIMMVETHTVTTNEYGVSELRVEGRSFETYFENRPSIATFEPLKDAEYHIPESYASHAMMEILTTIPTGSSGLWDQRMQIPVAFAIKQSVTNAVKRDFQVPRGDQYSAVLEIAQTHGIGIKNYITTIFAENMIQVDFYEGLDRTVSQTKNAPVLFSAGRGDFSSEEFIHTNTNYKNAVYVFANNTTYGIWTSRNGEPYSGLELRVQYVDGSDIAPPTDTGVRDRIEYERSLSRERALIHYSKAYRPNQDYSFQVSSDTAYQYGEHYNLGDLVSVEGTFGDRRTLQITEYIRNEDASGETAYPTMVAYNEIVTLE